MPVHFPIIIMVIKKKYFTLSNVKLLKHVYFVPQFYFIYY